MHIPQVLPSSSASSWPDIAAQADSLRDFLREAFADWFSQREPRELLDQDICFSLIDKALAEQTGDDFDPRSAGEAANASSEHLVEMLRLIYANDSEATHRVRAWSCLRLMGQDGRTCQQVADELGFSTRATPNKIYRQMQEALGGMPGRGDKSSAAREKYRKIRTGARRERKPWAALSVWNTLSSPSFQAAAA